MPAILSAFQRRASLLAASHTAIRIFNGLADGVEGLFIDAYGGNWLIQSEDRPQLPEFSQFSRMNVDSIYWKQLVVSGDTSPQFLAGRAVAERFTVNENKLNFLIDFEAGYSQGLFLDQRDNREWVKRRAGGLRVLNLFAYTCGFGLAASAGGATEVVNVDLSRRYLQWGQDNYRLNGLPVGDRDFIFGDAFNWLERLQRGRRQFEMVIVDPPTFSRSRDSGSFSVQRDYGKLLTKSLAVTSDNGVIIAFANTLNWPLAQFVSVADTALSGSKREIVAASDRMSLDFSGSNYLKCLLITKPECAKTWQQD